MFKYYSHAGAAATLRNRTVQLSTPTAFNDPFDTHLDDPLGLDPADFVPQLQNAFVEFILGDIEYSRLRNGRHREMIIRMHQAFASASPQQREEFRREAAGEDSTRLYDVETLQVRNDQISTYLRQSFSRYGIFCASRRADSLLMWSHYASEHRGFVFEFLPGAEKDSPLLIARPVVYTTMRPLLYRTPIDMIVKSLMMSIEDVTREIISDIVYSKAAEWAYEEEERLYVPDFVGAGKDRAYLQFQPQELISLIIGCRAPYEQAYQLVGLAREINPAVTIKRAQMDRREYRIAIIDGL